MAHWDGLNLDWLPTSMGTSPKPGTLSEDVARTWDGLLEAAADNGVYVQLVLQHHGQYTTFNDSNWAENPWNAANPEGFLKSPGDFFTDRNARVMTLLKYRYIIARWGWSPAIVSWELFNEVHWTNAIRDGHVAEVARWHSDVANYIRLLDIYGHLITTSTENIGSPIYEKMDYYQPHLYAANMLAGARIFTPPYASLAKSSFTARRKDDHQPFRRGQGSRASTSCRPSGPASWGRDPWPPSPGTDGRCSNRSGRTSWAPCFGSSRSTASPSRRICCRSRRSSNPRRACRRGSSPESSGSVSPGSASTIPPTASSPSRRRRSPPCLWVRPPGGPTDSPIGSPTAWTSLTRPR